ncbi:ArdC-like ssDNA-binding domain-containing protein [Brevibacillus laterosporus]|uniref:Antirestriction protein n=1 Tax=Brevibacillus laterosporus LMG 15441 TaxID=1042163 RepID=A0A075R6N9_BRELA|nr:ArdC family protein [Brevibacillus laterosporus]AIG26823.1 antirestriction protein [Brevibacillus laterosporus LMG 15441]
MSKVYGIITNKIIKLLEEGVAPWRKPWNSIGLAVNWVTQKPYRGINTMLLKPGEYATKKQIKNAGGKIKEKKRKKDI